MVSAEVAKPNGDIGDHHIYDDIIRALSMKREQLDRDIQEFKAEKEKEYREYEEQLRKQNAGGGEPAGLKGTSPSISVHKLGEGQRRPEPRIEDSSERRLSRQQRTARQALNEAFGNGFEGGREWEGVFTPEYLGLVDGNKHHVNGTLQPHAAAAEGNQKLSISASLHPPLTYPWASSPLQTPHVSFSAPEQSPTKTHHRSDSANSTLSVSSLRSSMKDPKTPKSPKRVLFSIEDGVVSPSTSPTLSRKGSDSASGADIMESALSFAKRGRDKKKKNRRKERGDGERGRRGREELHDICVSEHQGYHDMQQQPWTKSIPINPGRSPHPNCLNNKPVVTEDYEKIEKADDDDMFTFDEDLDARATSKPAETREDVEDEHDAASKTLTETGTSPHAGSLPIEIKWPGRRDSGGAG